MQKLRQHWPLASEPRPIVIIGAGSNVSGAHLLQAALNFQLRLPLTGEWFPDAFASRKYNVL